MKHELVDAAKLIAQADSLLVCAGAGMGVDSGLPDFRGTDGFWRAYPPYADLGLDFPDVSNPDHFVADSELAWGFYGHRLNMYRNTVPHRGFRVLREWESKLAGNLRVFTSNVDGHFQLAGLGCGSTNLRTAEVAEVHGSIHYLQCVKPCTDDIWPADDIEVDVDSSSMRARPPLPACRHCSGIARPNISMFGDFTWVGHRTDEQLEALNTWRRAQHNLVVIELGAGRAVPTVRRQAELVSAPSGALVRINPREPEIRHGRGIPLAMGAREALTAIDRLLTEPTTT